VNMGIDPPGRTFRCTRETPAYEDGASGGTKKPTPGGAFDIAHTPPYWKRRMKSR